MSRTDKTIMDLLQSIVTEAFSMKGDTSCSIVRVPSEHIAKARAILAEQKDES